jgi:predicted Zn-dependent protease
MAEAARNAFGRWERVADVPVRFRFVGDSAHADVRVRWIDAFPMRRTGQADLTWRRDGWLQTGSLTLATHTQDGDLLTADAVYTVALHEIGHLLGLDHSDDSADVMYQSTEIHDITARDRRTARLLYQIPPGSYRAENR